MPQIDTNIWVDLRPVYTGLNTRTGTSAITDTDYTNFAPFYVACYDNEPNEYILYNYLLHNKLTLDTGIDESITYVGMYNTDLPQLNIYCFDTLPYSTQDNPAYKTDNAQIQSFIFTDLMSYHLTSGWAYAGNVVMNKDFDYYDNQLWLWKNGIKGDYPFLNPITAVNPNGLYQIYTSFGVKSLILEINVAYKTGTGTYAPNFDRCTLAVYAAHTTEWKEQHPIVKAYCLPYIRDNINGTYEHTTQYFWDNGVQYKPSTLTPIFTLPLMSQVEGYPDILTYTYSLGLENTINGYLPLYGDFADDMAIKIGSTAETGGIMSVLMGCNKGTLNSITYSAYRNYWLELEGTDDNIEWLRHAAAAYGLFFCDSIGTLGNSGRDETRWIDNNMCLGTIDENGRTNGDYTKGALNATQRQFNWSDSTESPFDPSAPPVPPPMPYDDTTVFNDIGNIATLTRRYALTASDVEALGSELWQISADLINSVQNDEWTKYTADVIDTFLVNDPLSCIVSLEKYPMTIPDKSGPVTVKLGKAETNISANITSATTHTYSFKGQLIQPKYGNSFLDYEPYTHMELYVPFCGTVTLDPRDYMGHTLNIRLVVDFTTGTCVGYIMSDSLVIDTVNGSLAVSIPVTGIDSTTLAANITNGIINTRNARYNHIFGTLGKVASPAGLVSNVSNLWSSASSILTSQQSARAAEYELSHQPAPPHTIGSASPIGSWAIDFKARLLIYYPTGEIIDNSKEFLCFNDTVFYKYQEQIGFARVDPVAQLSEHFRGLTVAIAPVLSGMVTDTSGEPATDPELQLIARALEEGVII